MRKLRNEELNRKSVKEFKATPKSTISIMLDNVRSMHNVGSIFRTADAFLIDKLFLTGITASPPHREIAKTALGATETVSWEYEPSSQQLVDNLKDQGYAILVVEQVEGATFLNDFQPDPDHKYCLVFGHEVDGVNEEIVNKADVCLEIPQFGTKHSLNISVSAGIIIWDIIFKLDQHYRQ